MTVLQGLVTAGAWYLFLSTLDRFLFPVMSISSFWTQVQTGLSAAERIFALIDANTPSNSWKTSNRTAYSVGLI